MESTLRAKLLHFLQEEIGISADAVSTAQRILERLNPDQSVQSVNLLPIVLWQYGLVSFEQLTQVLDWLDKTGWW
ncbi:DUF2949 domain-containing protein [Kovacikia minuta CCNUW1]|uniref:DUF2949 domain-containing protein n=1 Tax=Kovacikia minuta TaxID=2931930 RepID=UPI001CC8FDFC|nr:DUF2949 domain-containing protein [Kovacikia minuta]UBF28119.1 DUF2949 domain-containing protein [Kovacikia minuta CCNUW1]